MHVCLITVRVRKERAQQAEQGLRIGVERNGATSN